MIGFICLLFVGLLAGTYGVNSLLQQKSKHLVELKSKNDVLNGQTVSLTKAKKDVKTYSQLNDIAKSIVPQDKDQAEAVREIANLAAASGIPQLSSITFPASTLGGTGVTVTPGKTTPKPAAGADSHSNLTQLIPVVGMPGLYQLQITITQTSDSAVPYNSFLKFLDKLEQNRRTAQVIGIALQPDSKNSSYVSFTLNLNEFIKP